MGCHAIFTTDEEGYSPEIFSRLGEEIYIAGLNSSSLALPDLATGSVVDENAVNKLMRTSKRLLGVDDLKVDDLEVLRKGLCFRPVTNRGTPFLTRIPDNMLGDVRVRGAGDGGVWLAAGHGPWGISLSLGSGKVMAEMIQGKPPSVDIRLGL
jgi:glycine/D-amino acid oxidase-like deaminating enzyme